MKCFLWITLLTKLQIINNNINCWQIYIYFNQTKLKTRIIKEQNIQIKNQFHKMAEKVSPARLRNAPGWWGPVT